MFWHPTFWSHSLSSNSPWKDFEQHLMILRHVLFFAHSEISRRADDVLNELVYHFLPSLPPSTFSSADSTNGSQRNRGWPLKSQPCSNFGDGLEVEAPKSCLWYNLEILSKQGSGAEHMNNIRTQITVVWLVCAYCDQTRGTPNWDNTWQQWFVLQDKHTKTKR